MGPSSEPVTPIPVINNLKHVIYFIIIIQFVCSYIKINFKFLKNKLKFNEDDKQYIELKGENFNSNLKVWLDDNECETIFK
jgi:hypothetical protein